MFYKTHKRSQIDFSKSLSLTKQAPRQECDINYILKKYEKTSLLSHVNKTNGIYGDFSNTSDYQSSLNAVINADDNFNGLPASLRARFQNDPAQLLNFIEDDKNYSEAEKLGLIPKATMQKNAKIKQEIQNLKTKADALKNNDDKTTTK